MKPEPVTLPETIMSKVHVRPDNGCWEWQGCVSRGRGYGLVMYGRRLRLVHRVAYEIGVGAIPSGQVVMHRCDNPICVRPDHLRAGSQSENIQEMWDKGRNAEFYPKKLTYEKAQEIRRLATAAFGDGPAMRAIAAQFGVSARTVREIRLGRTWFATRRRRLGRRRSPATNLRSVGEHPTHG